MAESPSPRSPHHPGCKWDLGISSVCIYVQMLNMDMHVCISAPACSSGKCLWIILTNKSYNLNVDIAIYNLIKLTIPHNSYRNIIYSLDNNLKNN